MYNAHRGMVPAPNSRLTELLEQLRQEFDNQSRSTGEFEHQRSYPLERSWSPSMFRKLTPWIVTGQLQEMEMIRSKVYQLEQAQVKMKQE